MDFDMREMGRAGQAVIWRDRRLAEWAASVPRPDPSRRGNGDSRARGGGALPRSLQRKDGVGAEHERHQHHRRLAERADDEGPEALPAHGAEVGLEADAVWIGPA
jgi:hypothetical protein